TSLACAHHDEHHRKNPQVVVISLDGARPDLVEHYLKTGVLDRKTGLGRLKARGVAADQNITVTPSVTAVAHIAIATRSTAARRRSARWSRPRRRFAPPTTRCPSARSAGSARRASRSRRRASRPPTRP